MRRWIYSFFFASVALVIGIACARIVLPSEVVLLGVGIALLPMLAAGCVVGVYSIAWPTWAKLRVAAKSYALAGLALTTLPAAGDSVARLFWGRDDAAIRAAVLLHQIRSDGNELSGRSRVCVAGSDVLPFQMVSPRMAVDASPRLLRTLRRAGVDARRHSDCVNRRWHVGQRRPRPGALLVTRYLPFGVPVNIGAPEWRGPGEADVEIQEGGGAPVSGSGTTCRVHRTGRHTWGVQWCHMDWIG
jgi:hypothetical protein